ncbi:GDSL-like Lipase/Acylhydrolase [Colletotrichum higginsianum IMI 349063]|uniref:GDSL-like Lipase/Acylhydrolase n=1 Tax=Colletotrichum higginsianum (strain IMI 349063) TaxID=759273 RepID=A0A1B7YT25_COLHI|nr:GDSL-like Lipase/Acylhydrolase [Colletotrichum higginsianum IMI 349063]OBR15187.1 GDSL-like Lipase/Acylhydrolase [Colletotrichum higginsianum IMI 349063]
MRLTLGSLLLGASAVLSAPAQRSEADGRHTLWLAGDSTMAPDGGHNGTQGWGEYLHYSLDASRIRVNNSAYAGRSARTFTREGRFQRIIDQVQPGDWVVIEFGHNDGPGNPINDTVKNRVDCPGIGNNTCPVTFNGEPEIVQTYTTYLRNASSIFLSLGARVVISTSTPINPYSTGTFSWAPTIYSWYSWHVVESLGGPAAGIYYVPHGNYSAQALEVQGPAAVVEGFPMDPVHMSPRLADSFAGAFVLGLKCGTSPLQQYVVNATSRLEGDRLGTCLQVNATLPI